MNAFSKKNEHSRSSITHKSVERLIAHNLFNFQVITTQRLWQKQAFNFQSITTPVVLSLNFAVGHAVKFPQFFNVECQDREIDWQLTRHGDFKQNKTEITPFPSLYSFDMEKKTQRGKVLYQPYRVQRSGSKHSQTQKLGWISAPTNLMTPLDFIICSSWDGGRTNPMRWSVSHQMLMKFIKFASKCEGKNYLDRLCDTVRKKIISELFNVSLKMQTGKVKFCLMIINFHIFWTAVTRRSCASIIQANKSWYSWEQFANNSLPRLIGDCDYDGKMRTQLSKIGDHRESVFKEIKGHGKNLFALPDVEPDLKFEFRKRELPSMNSKAPYVFPGLYFASAKPNHRHSFSCPE